MLTPITGPVEVVERTSGYQEFYDQCKAQADRAEEEADRAADIVAAGGGGGGGGISNHGLLSGLNDDDHPQYILADGTRSFSAPVTGVSPTASTHLATKGYVDAEVAAGGGGGGGGVVNTVAGRPAIYAGNLPEITASIMNSTKNDPLDDSNSICSIALIGDSLHIQNPRPHGLKAQLEAMGFEDSYARFIVLDTAVYKGAMDGHTLTFQGSVSDSDHFEEEWSGPSCKHSRLISSGDGFTVTCDSGMPDWADTSVILYRIMTGGGTFSYSVDGAPAVNVDTSVGTNDTLGTVTIPSGSSLVVTHVSGTSWLTGVRLDSISGKGFAIMHAGNGGSTIAQHDNASAASWQKKLEVLDPDVILISLGGNDVQAAALAGDPPATIASDVKTLLDGYLPLITAYRRPGTVDTGVPIIYIGIGDADSDGAPLNIDDSELDLVRQATYESVIDTNRVAWVDPRQIIGDYDSDSYPDGIHESDEAANIIMGAVASLITGSAARSYIPMTVTEAEAGVGAEPRAVSASILKSAILEHGGGGGGGGGANTAASYLSADVTVADQTWLSPGLDLAGLTAGFYAISGILKTSGATDEFKVRFVTNSGTATGDLCFAGDKAEDPKVAALDGADARLPTAVNKADNIIMIKGWVEVTATASVELEVTKHSDAAVDNILHKGTWLQATEL